MRFQIHFISYLCKCLVVDDYTKIGDNSAFLSFGDIIEDIISCLPRIPYGLQWTFTAKFQWSPRNQLSPLDSLYIWPMEKCPKKEIVYK